MAKRRTRKDKEGAKHQFLISWQGKAKKDQIESNVKGQFENKRNPAEAIRRDAKKAVNMAKDNQLSFIKRDVAKSLILASFILILELVVYFSLK